MSTTEKKEQNIDFVMIWVDGNDPKWQEKKRDEKFSMDNEENKE